MTNFPGLGDKSVSRLDEVKGARLTVFARVVAAASALALFPAVLGNDP